MYHEKLDGEYFGIADYMRQPQEVIDAIEYILRFAKSKGVKLLWADTYAPTMDRGHLWFRDGLEKEARLLAWIQFKSNLVKSDYRLATYMEGKLFGFSNKQIADFLLSGRWTREQIADVWTALEDDYEYYMNQPMESYRFDTFNWFTLDDESALRNKTFTINMQVIDDYPTTISGWAKSKLK